MAEERSGLTTDMDTPSELKIVIKLRESSTCSQLRNRSREKHCRARGKSQAKTKWHRAREKLQYRGAGSEDTDGEQRRENLGQVDHPSGASEPQDQKEGYTVPCVSQPCGIPPSHPRGSPHRKGQHIFQRHLVLLQNGSPNVPQLVIVPVKVSRQKENSVEQQPGNCSLTSGLFLHSNTTSGAKNHCPDTLITCFAL